MDTNNGTIIGAKYTTTCFKSTILKNPLASVNLSDDDLIRYKAEPSSVSLIASHHIKISFTKLQKRVVKPWFKASDMMYNLTIDYLNKCHEENVNPRHWYETRTLLIQGHPEFDDTPFDIKAAAIEDAYNARKSNIAKIRINKGNAKKFVLSHRLEESSIVLVPHTFTDDCSLFYCTYFSKMVNKMTGNAKKTLKPEFKNLSKLKRAAKLGRVSVDDYKFEADRLAKLCDFSSNLKIKYAESVTEINHACRIIKGKTGYVLVKPYTYTKDQPLVGKKQIASLDPGIKIFQTCFSADECVEFGKDIDRKLQILRRKTNKLKAKLRKTTKKRKIYGIKKAILKSREKIKNVVNELHWQTASYLTSNYEKIIIGKLDTQSIIQNDLHPECKKSLQNLSHFKFRNRLIYKANRSGSTVMVTTEEYTSKTCTSCGFVYNDLGDARIFKCPHCSISYGRDIGGARNILLRALTKDQDKATNIGGRISIPAAVITEVTLAC